MYDEDFYNSLAKEEKGIQLEIRAIKNQILNMTSTQRKQDEWNKYFRVEPLVEDNMVY
jgi:peptidoglycan hydrolase CwlO-like protein